MWADCGYLRGNGPRKWRKCLCHIDLQLYGLLAEVHLDIDLEVQPRNGVSAYAIWTYDSMGCEPRCEVEGPRQYLVGNVTHWYITTYVPVRGPRRGVRPRPRINTWAGRNPLAYNDLCASS